MNAQNEFAPTTEQPKLGWERQRSDEELHNFIAKKALDFTDFTDIYDSL